MPYYSDNPVLDALRHDTAQEIALNKLPKCTCCGEPIQQDDAFCIDGQYWCDNCMEDMRVELNSERWN